MSTADDITTEMRSAIQVAAGERQLGETRMHQFKRASRAFGIPVGRIQSIWYGKGVRVWADELENVRRRVEEIVSRQDELNEQRILNREAGRKARASGRGRSAADLGL